MNMHIRPIYLRLSLVACGVFLASAIAELGARRWVSAALSFLSSVAWWYLGTRSGVHPEETKA